jgi:hypothetical protein
MAALIVVAWSFPAAEPVSKDSRDGASRARDGARCRFQ